MFIFNGLLLCNMLICATTGLDSSRDFLSSRADSLYYTGNFNSAITEYKRVLFFNWESPDIWQIYKNVGECYKELEQWDLSILAYKTAIMEAPGVDERDKIKIRIAYVSIVRGENDNGELILQKLLISSEDTLILSQSSLLLTIILIQKNRWLEAQQALNRLSAHCVSLTQNSSFIELQGLLNSAQNQKYKSPEIASWISTFLPGAGQVYAGDIKDGVNAFLLNAAFFYTGWSFIANGAWYELVTTAMIGQRYYLGNRYRARLIAEKNNKSQQEIFQRTMFDYVRRIYCVK